MDASRFDRMTRLLSTVTPRRQTVMTVALGLLGLTGMTEVTLASPGCKNVNRKCDKAKDCCSGVCNGKKGKKRCKAHDTGGCRAGQGSENCGGTPAGCTTATGFPAGSCQTTTGNAGYCLASSVCARCTRDADCRAEFGARSACIACTGCAEGTLCAGPDAIG